MPSPGCEMFSWLRSFWFLEQVEEAILLHLGVCILNSVGASAHVIVFLKMVIWSLCLASDAYLTTSSGSSARTHAATVSSLLASEEPSLLVDEFYSGNLYLFF
jgi:hypothetical protein